MTISNIRLRMSIHFVNASWQERKGLLMSDDRLMKFAQAKALDMASRNYFDHKDPDDVWPNQWVRIFKYVLPEQWPYDANYVESVGKGFSDPESFMEALYVSEAHRPHVTGNVPFFYAHRYFGVGYAVGSSIDGTPVPLYVLVTAPPELVVKDNDNHIYLGKIRK